MSDYDVWMIQNSKNSTEFWSNACGWVDFNSADAWDSVEADGLSLPLDGVWVREFDILNNPESIHHGE